MPNQKEIATIEVGGQKFEDWETVSVEVAFPNTHRTAIFTVSEGNPPARTHGALQIKMNDPCTIKLGGELVLTGYVVSRQAFADANNHGVMIEAWSKPSDMVRTSCMMEGGQFIGKTIVEIAKAVYGEQGVEVKTAGEQSNMKIPFEHVQVTPGESGFHLVERLARERLVWIGDTGKGELVLDGGNTESGEGGAKLVEGQNIQWIRAKLSDIELMQENFVFAQSLEGNDKWGRDATEIKASVKEPRMKRNKRHKTIMEQPANPKTALRDAQIRARFEYNWRAQTLIQVEVGLQGWFKPGGGGLWDAGPQQAVHLKSPMAMLDDRLLIHRVQFKQDNEQGTMTILDLIDPESFNGGATQID